jgi:regulator of protease activity HflC (stomatin/prohibitin superfamily)
VPKVTIREYEQGLDYRKGKFVGVLGPGQYRIWAFTGREIIKVDMRQAALQVTGQETLTADQASVRLNLLVQYTIADPAKAIHQVVSYADALHQAVQLAARDLVAERTVEQLLAERNALSVALTEIVAQRAQAFGVEVVQAVVKDTILDPELRAAYALKLTVEQRGQAALIEARHQVAAARAQANAAKLLEENPAMLMHRQLDVLSKAVTQGYGHHFVVLPEALANVVRKLGE